METDYYKHYSREWRKRNQERIREYNNSPKNKDRHRIAKKRWYDKYKHTDKYKARQRAIAKINKIFKKYDYKCNRCGEDNINLLQIHHLNYNPDVSPLDNCILLCVDCHKKERLS